MIEISDLLKRDNIYVLHTGNALSGYIVKARYVSDTKARFTLSICKYGRNEAFNVQFNKANGNEWGAGLYHYHVVTDMSDEQVEEYNRKNKLRVIRNNLYYNITQNISLNEVSDEDILTIWDIIKKYKKD